MEDQVKRNGKEAFQEECYPPCRFQEVVGSVAAYID